MSDATTSDGGRPPVVEAVGLCKHFDGGVVRALDGVEMVVEEGEFVAITGPSGCGKSTLLHLLAALDIPTSGVVRVHGDDLSEHPDLDSYRRLEIGLVFQLHNLLPHLNALENVEVAMIGTSLSLRERRERAAGLLAEVQLEGSERRQLPKLSGGERQRVAVARALVNEPGLLLADEPTGSLDSESVTKLLTLFQRLRDERGITIVMVTHDTSVAAVADRVVAMKDGRVVEPPRR